MSNEQASKKTAQPRHLRLAVLWAIAGTVAILVVLPYYVAKVLPTVQARASSVPVPLLLVISALLQGLLLLPLNWLGLRLGWSVGLDSPLARAWVYHTPRLPLSWSRWAIAAATGFGLGLLILGITWIVLPQPPRPEIARWKGLLASFCGGIAEELLWRLFVMSVLIWLTGKLARKGQTKPSSSVYWVGIVVAAVLFGASHLPVDAQVYTLTAATVVSIITLNAVAGIACGLFYWKWGLEHAMVAHFCADLALHVVGDI
jgi:membrane protease YdiL (CAAX protease family)